MVERYIDRGYYYGERQEFRVIIDDYDRHISDDFVSPVDLGCYMILFGEVCESIYTLGSNILQPFDIKILREAAYSDRYQHDELLEDFASRIEHVWDRLPLLNTNLSLQRLAEEVSTESGFTAYRRREAILIRKISRNSPIEMICYGMPWVLIAAVIFSGGTIKFNGFECRLPPIGHGIHSLKQALSQNRRSRPRISRQKIKDSIEKD